ncbi:PAS domain-containing protein [Spirosoma areae]
MQVTLNSSEFTFLRGGGEMGRLMRSYNWSQTSVGSPDTWPQSLRTTLSILLHSKFPMFLFWGQDLLCFYNDAYRPSLGTNGKHPSALGKPGAEVWPEIWAIIKPLIDQVLAGGEATWSEDQLIPIYRNGNLEDVYWTFSYSPVSDESGEPAGVFVTCSETTEKVATVNKLAEGKDQLAFAIEATELGTWDLNPVTNRFRANARLKDWFGLQPDDEVELPLAINVITEKDRQRVTAAIQQALQYESGGRYAIDYTIIHPVTQQERTVRARGRAWFTEEKTAYRFNGTLQDITEQKKAEQALKESEERFQGAIAAVQGILWTNNADGEMEGEQVGWATLTGQRREEYQGYGWASAVHPDDAQPTIDAWQEAVQKRRTFVFEHRVRVHNGDWELFSIRAIPLLAADGSIREWVGVHTNITERRKAEQQQQEAAELLQSVLDVSTVGISVLKAVRDEQGELIDFEYRMANRVTEQINNRTDLMGNRYSAIHSAYRQAGIFDDFVKVVQTGHIIERERHYTGEGFDNWYATVTVKLDDGVVFSFRDITQDITARQQLEASEAKLRSVIATAPAAIGLFVGRDLIVEMPNQSFIDIVGKGPDIVGRPLREVMPELESQPYLQILDDVYTSGRMFQSFGSQVNIVQQGVMTHNFYNITYTPLFDAEGHVYAILDIAIDVTERILAQQRIEESWQQLLDSFEQSPVGIAIIARENLTFRMANTFYGELTGRTPVQLVGKPLLEAMPELRGQGFDQLLQEVFATGIPFTAREVAVNVVRNNQLETIYLDFTYQPQRDINQLSGAEQISAILVVATDITQQVLTRQTIEASEHNLRSLVESAPFPIGVYVGREMRIQLANQAILDVWGKGNEVTGKLYADLLPELETGEIFAQLDAVYTTGIPFHAKNQRVDLMMDGRLQPYYFNYSFTPLYDAEGNVYGVMNTAAEITDLALAKQKVEETKESLRGAIELAELGTWEIDLTTGILAYSERARMWFGIGKDEIITIERAYRPIREEDRPLVKAAITHAITPGTNGIYEVEYRVDPAETGRERILHAQGKAFLNEKGEAYKISGTVQDVTEQRKIQLTLEQQVRQRTQQLQASVQDLQRSNQNLQQFAYIASHDLQEPLRKIQSFGDLLRKEYAAQLGEGVDHLQRMQAAASRMSTLIKDLLAFARISTQQDTSSSVSLTQVVRAAVNDLDLVVEETDALIHIADLPTVQGDPSQLNQLFQNLLSNALKFRRTDSAGAPIAPTVRVAAQVMSAANLPDAVKPSRVAQMYHRIDVTDNGIGFDEKYVDRIFQVFQRLHGRNEFAGTGIGLAICEKVVANHGGAITATSQPGQGATFSVYLPVSV